MLWIPIAFFCTQIGCTFLSGEPEYSAIDCFKAVEVATQRLKAEPRVTLYHLDCVAVNPT